MPFKSAKQRKYLYASKPEVAKKFAEDGKKSKSAKKKSTTKAKSTKTKRKPKKAY